MSSNGTVHEDVVFTSKEIADGHAVSDYATWLATTDNQKYRNTTSLWATPRERVDGKWGYRRCPAVAYGSGVQIEPHDPDKYLPDNV